MQSLETGRGYAGRWTVTLRDETGRVLTDVYDGSESLDLVVTSLEGGALTLTASAAVWADASQGLITLSLGAADTALMGPGPRGLSIGLTADSVRVECYRARLRVLDRPV